MRASRVNSSNAFKGCAVLAVLLTLSVAANAYTVVLRGGKRIEIPSGFTLTQSTLTYEVSPGIQVTLATAAIDVAATEKANNEPPGSFLRRVYSDSSEPTAVGVAPRSASPPVRTITNRDLETTAQRRRASEVTYENRRKQLGLPTVEESRRKAEADSAVIMNRLELVHAADKESENYWRQRASALRTETAALDAELNYVRRQLDETSSATLNGSFVSVTSALPFGTFGSFGTHGQFGRGEFGRPVTQRPWVFGSPRNASPVNVLPNRGAARARVFVNPLGFPRSYQVDSPALAPNLTVFGSTSAYDASFERSWLITRFNELAAARAELNARWRELEDEARRAGAPPGWLRP